MITWRTFPSTTSLELFLLAALINSPVLSRVAQDWSSSPEAYFLTPEETQQWKHLDSEDARQQFRETYWKRRDPTPQTDRNEFKETVLARIRSADAQFTTGKTPGSRSARGLVFVVLGPPSIQQQIAGPIKGAAPQMITPGRLSIPNDAFDTTEFHTWIYDRETRMDLLRLLQIPSLEVAFIVEPGHRDEMRDRNRFQRWREKIARHTIAAAAAVPISGRI